MELLSYRTTALPPSPDKAEPKPAQPAQTLRRIVLREDYNCPYLEKRGQYDCTVRAGGDMVQGYVEICGELDDQQSVEIRFEGELITDIRLGCFLMRN